MNPWLELGEDERRLFLAECEELLEQLEAGLLDLEQGRGGVEVLHEIFRAAHTIKGSAATVGLEGMARLTHALENRLDELRSGLRQPAAGEVSTMLAAVDALRAMLAAVAAGEEPAPPPASVLAALEAGEPAGEEPAGNEAAPPSRPPGAPAHGEPAAPVPQAGGAGGPRSGSGEASQVPRDRADWVVEAELDPGCAMPAVRALQVLMALEPLGTLVASDPDRDALEAEWNGTRVRAWLAGPASRDALREAVGGIPDVLRVRVQPARPPAADRGTPAGGGRHADDRTIRVDVELLDLLLNLVGELVVERGRLGQLGHELAQRPAVHDLADELFRVNVQLARITGALQDAVLKARMLPIARVFRRFPRLVRDLALQLDKDVELELEGEDTELDRTLLDVIADPLLHLVRNALDHGIEPPEERRRLGKPLTGRIRLSAAREGHHVVVRVQDDGRGIDPERLRAAAVAKGLLPPERAAALTDREALDLMFLPGFSTAARVTDISGRGVGLDVVRQSLEQAGGRVEVDSRPGRGTTFTLVLPLTLATLRALLVRVGTGLYAVPMADVAEAVRVAPEDVASLQGRWVTTVRGQVVPLLWLRQYAEPGFRPPRPPEPVVAVLVESQGRPVGLVVEELLGEQEVVVKGLGEILAGVRGLSGATILGDGRLALILDVPDLLAELAAGLGGRSTPADAAAAGAGAGHGDTAGGTRP